MPNAQHQTPDYTTDDAASYKAKIDGNAAVVARIGAAYQPYANSTPNMTVKVAAGALLVAGAVVENAIQTTGTITAPVSNSRIDRVVIDSTTGVVSVITGTSGVSPSAPALTAGKLPVAQVLLTSATTAITNSMITDERAMSAVIAGPATGSGLTMATARLLGRTTASSGAIEEITVGAGLSLSGGSLTAAALTLGTPTVTTSGTNIDYTSIPSTAKAILVSLNGVSTNGTSNYLLQIGDSGGIENTGYSGGVVSSGTSGAGSTSGFSLTNGSVTAASTVTGTFLMVLQNASTNTWSVFGNLYMASANVFVAMAGVKSLSAALDRLRLTTSAGDTFDAGEMNIAYW